MKFLRRWVALALCLAMCCALLPQMSLLAHAETNGSCGAEGDNLTWTLDTASGVLTITGTGAMADYNGLDVLAPWYESRASIKSVVLPEGLTNIGRAAFFDCGSLTTVSLPASLTTIGSDAFEDCAGLRSISLPSGLTVIEMFAFANCTGLTELVIPASVTEIGMSAFSFCTGLQTLGLPGGQADIGIEAFYGCSGLTALTIPAGTQSVSRGCFGECTGLTTVSFPAGLKSVEAYGFYGCTGLTGVSFPAGMEELGEKAFYGCTGLQSVAIPEGMTELGEQAFAGCVGLSVVDFPASLTSIGVSAISGCTSLTAINVAAGNPSYCSDNGVLFDSAKTVLLQYPAARTDSSYVVPAGVTQIDNEAFFGNTALTSVTLPEGLLNIGWLAFYGCPGMTSVTIPASVTAIQGMAFGYYSDAEGNETAVEGFTIYGMAKTAAQTYAKMNGFRFVFENPFADVQESDYFYDAVMWALDLEVTAGVDDTHFGPNNDCTREQIVTFLWKTEGSPKTDAQNNDFTDVMPDQYYYRAVIWALENSVTAGIGNQLFGVGYSCTREQAVTFLWKAAGAPEPQTTNSQFSDVNSGDYYYKPVLWAAENGITAGVGDGMFGVGQTCTRAQIITFLYKTFGAEN